MSHSPTREPEALPSLHYLTVQDLLWINLQVTKRINAFNFATLEEAVFYQYLYGTSEDVPRQAGQFLSGFLKNAPFDAGNTASAFVGCIAFLLLNGYSLDLDDSQAALWMDAIANSQTTGVDAVKQRVRKDEDTHSALLQNVEQSVTEVMRRYPETVAKLAAKG